MTVMFWNNIVLEVTILILPSFPYITGTVLYILVAFFEEIKQGRYFDDYNPKTGS